MTHKDGAVGSEVASSQPLEKRTSLVDLDVPRSSYPLYAASRSRHSAYWSEPILHWMVSRKDARARAQVQIAPSGIGLR